MVVIAETGGARISAMRAVVATLLLLLNSCERSCDKPGAGCSCDGSKEMHACDGTIGLTCAGSEWKPDDAVICEPGRL